MSGLSPKRDCGSRRVNSRLDYSRYNARIIFSLSSNYVFFMGYWENNDDDNNKIGHRTVRSGWSTGWSTRV